MRCFAALFVVSLLALAEEIPIVGGVEQQPLNAQVARLTEALNMLGDPLLSGDVEQLRRATTSEQIQRILDKHCLVSVSINPEGRLSVQQGPAAPELEEKGWRTFLVKVHNEAGTTAMLAVDSPNAGQLANRPDTAAARRFMDLNLYTKPPMKRVLSGLAVEYGILQLSSRDPGKREAKLIFDAGQGSQDLGFRNQVDILFTVKPATKVTFRVTDQDGKPTTAGFLIRDSKGRVYPSQAKRLAPDFFFQTQVYRADGESVLLPHGEFTIEYSRGPEYRIRSERIMVGAQPITFTAKLQRWIDPARLGWYSGDHHIHAAGCAHYEKPTEGVYPQDMMRHILGEDLKIGSVLTWGPGWYFQKTFFEGKDNKLSTADNLIHYDVEVSGFPSSHTGHIVLLGLREQDYPGTKRIEEWPSWGLPVFRWAKKQGAVAGFAHSGWGLALKQEKLLTSEIPPFDGIGANEYIVGVTHDLVDFISTVDTPYANELNIWYHTLNVGYRTKISGETDFPCIYDGRVGLGRSYVHQTKTLDYTDWVAGIKEGRNYVSDGKSHLIDFRVNGTPMGQELRLTGAGPAHITAQVAALLLEQPNESIRRLAYDQKPFWDVERARVGDSRMVPVELIVNGVAVARKEVVADGALRPIAFDYNLDRSSWIALRILPSSHTNPVFVVVNGKPIRSKGSAEWCLKAVDQCWKQKSGQIRLQERGEAEQAYEYARQMYRARLKEAF